MATTNKSLTTYLPAESVEWLEGYCLDYKHLLNKDGNPKLGTALADIISRLTDGELTLPVKIEPISPVPDNAQYGTEISTLKAEVEDLKKLLTEYGTSKLPDTVLDLDEVSTMINTAIHKASIGNNDTHGNTKRIDVLTTGSTEVQIELAQINSAIGELETFTRSQLATMKEELKTALADRAVVPTTDYPDWVKAAHKPHYNRLLNNPDLLNQVATICALTDSNDSIAIALIPLGFKKGDGTPLDRPTITNIKKVVENLKMNNELFNPQMLTL